MACRPRSGRRSPIPTRWSSTSRAKPLMNMQEMGTAVQFPRAGQEFILNNERLGHGAPVAAASAWRTLQPELVRQPARFRQAGRGLWLQGSASVSDPAELDDAIREMIGLRRRPGHPRLLVEKHENCFPMIPRARPHNEMLLGEGSTEGGRYHGAAARWFDGKRDEHGGTEHPKGRNEPFGL